MLTLCAHVEAYVCMFACMLVCTRLCCVSVFVRVCVCVYVRTVTLIIHWLLIHLITRSKRTGSRNIF
jgi:hypothetical protein